MTDEWQIDEDEIEEQETGEDIDEYDEQTRVLEDSDLRQIYMNGLQEMEASGYVDIGNLASWIASTSKHGCGVKELREDSAFSYWQSDGPQPHFIEVQFSKRVAIERISMFSDIQFDESYTPGKVMIEAGTSRHDLQQVSVVGLREPNGWCHIMLNEVRDDGVMKAFLIRLTIVSNHQNGKDTRIRALKIFSPAKKPSDIQLNDSELGFNTVAMLSETVIR